MRNWILFLLTLCSIVLFVSGNEYHQHHYRTQEDDDAMDDYQLYALIDRMTSLTKYKTFYEVLEVPPNADNVTISAAFRQKSKLWHPDWHQSDPDAQSKYAILSSIAGILKNVDTRKRYDWILNEAPIWHKSGYYVKKYMTAKLSVGQVLIICLVVITLMQSLTELVTYAVRRLRQWDANRSLKMLSKSEMKRLERKVVKVSEITEEMKAGSPNLESWTLANETIPRISFRHLFIFWLPLRIYELFRYGLRRRPVA